MLRLTFLLHGIAATVIAGTGIVVVLVLGFVSALAIGGAIAFGLVLGLPVARLIAQKLSEE